MQRSKSILLIGMIALASFSAGRFLGPREVETKEVEKIVYKEREVKDETKDTKSTRKEIVRPDGTREIEIIRETQKAAHSDTQSETSQEKLSESKTTNAPNWSVGLYKGSDGYLGTLDRRILGGLFIGVYGRTDGRSSDYGVGVRLEF